MKHRSLSLPEMPDDGFRWNKYGEKTIRGGAAIREYFRCQLGCPADKGGTSCPAKKVMDRSLSQAAIADQPKKEEEEEEENEEEEGQQKQQHHHQNQQLEEQQQDDGLPATQPSWARKPQQAKGKRRPSSFKGEFSVQYLCQEHNHPPSPPAAASPPSTATAAAERAPSAATTAAAAAATVSECGANMTPAGALAAKARGLSGPKKQSVRSRFTISHLEIPNGSVSSPPSSSGSTGPATPQTPRSSWTPSSACHPPLRSPSLVPPRLARGMCASPPSIMTSSPSPSASFLASSPILSLPKSPGVAGGKESSDVKIAASATTLFRGLSTNVTSTATSSATKGNPGRGAVGQKADAGEKVLNNSSLDCMSRKRKAGQVDARPASTINPSSANGRIGLAKVHPPSLSLPAQVQGLTTAKKQKTEALVEAEEEAGLCQTASSEVKPVEDGEALILELFESLDGDDDLPHLHVEEQLSPRPALSRSLTYGDRTLPSEFSGTLTHNGESDGILSLATDSPWSDFDLDCDKVLHSMLDTPLGITSSTTSQEPHFHDMTEGVVLISPTACLDMDPGDPCLRMVESEPPMPAKPRMLRGESATTKHPGYECKSAWGDSCPHRCSQVLSLTAETSPKTITSPFDSGFPQVHNNPLHLFFSELFPATEPRPRARSNGSSLGSGSATQFLEKIYRTCDVDANGGSAETRGACHVGSGGGRSSDGRNRRSSICVTSGGKMDATTATSQVMEVKRSQSPPRLGGGGSGKGFEMAGQQVNQPEPHPFRSCVCIDVESGVDSTNSGPAPIAGKEWDTSTPLTLEDFLLTRLIFHVTELLKS